MRNIQFILLIVLPIIISGCGGSLKSDEMLEVQDFTPPELENKDRNYIKIDYQFPDKVEQGRHYRTLITSTVYVFSDDTYYLMGPRFNKNRPIIKKVSNSRLFESVNELLKSINFHSTTWDDETWLENCHLTTDHFEETTINIYYYTPQEKNEFQFGEYCIEYAGGNNFLKALRGINDLIPARRRFEKDITEIEERFSIRAENKRRNEQ